MAIAKKKVTTKKSAAAKKPAVRRGRPPKAVAAPAVPVEDPKPKEEGAAFDEPAPEVRSTSSLLEDIDILDLSCLTPVGRLIVLVELAQQGYVTNEGKPLLADLNVAAESPLHRVNSLNRMLHPATSEDAIHSTAVCRPGVGDIKVDLTRVGPTLPFTIERHSATYVRIG